jgi:hypothetical protein
MPKNKKPNTKRKYEEILSKSKIIESDLESESQSQSENDSKSLHKEISNLKTSLKCYSESNSSIISNGINPSSSSSDNSEEQEKSYEVEAIVGRKNRLGKLLYLIKWVGYPSDQNTWEPLENLSNVLDMIEEYDKINPTIRGRKKSKKQLPQEKEENIEDLIEKYKDYGLEAIIGNKIGEITNTSKDFTRITEVNEENSENKSLKSTSINDNSLNNLSQFAEENCDKIKKNEIMGDITKDRPLLIKYAKISNNKMQFLVKWKKRENGLEPFESYVPHETIKKLYPYVLIDFYESRLRGININNFNSKKKEN